MLNKSKTKKGYKLNGRDGERGKVKEFYIDDQLWTIRYLIIDTRNWWPGKKVLVSPNRIERDSWGKSKVFVKLIREAIRQSPEYTKESLFTRNCETVWHRQYDRHGYRGNEPADKEHSRWKHIQNAANEIVICVTASRVVIFVIHMGEELMIARSVWRAERTRLEWNTPSRAGLTIKGGIA